MKFFTPLLALLVQYYPQTFILKGVITKVYDGDTIMLTQSDHRKRKIRLVYIDAAEKEQGDWAQRSHRYLESFLNKPVRVKVVGEGFYKRLLGEIFFQQKSLNFELLNKGLVWLYPWSRFESLEQKEQYLKTEQSNKLNKRGVWGTSLLAPWKYRRKKRSRLK